MPTLPPRRVTRYGRDRRLCASVASKRLHASSCGKTGVAAHLYVTVCDRCHAKIEEERKDTRMCENCGIRPATQEHVERNALNDILGKPPGKKDGEWSDWLTWGLCEECFEDEGASLIHPARL
jgi:hypothetical protein